MQLFVSEYISGGALAESPMPASMLREGRAMWRAIVSDLAGLGHRVTTTLDARVIDSLDPVANPCVEVERISTQQIEKSAFERLASKADATLVIAPETDGILAQRVRWILEIGAKSLNCTPAAIELCGDKLRLSDLLMSKGIETIPTTAIRFNNPVPSRWAGTPCVIKPRDGAGSWLTFAIRNLDADTWLNMGVEFHKAGAADRAIFQPWIPGRAMSVGCICHPSGEVDLLPVACQNQGANFSYQGGTIPADISSDRVIEIQQLVRSACRWIPGLLGYIGIDLVVPDVMSESPVLVEINPRLTTSYVGYRQLCQQNLARHLLHAFDTNSPSQTDGESNRLHWAPGPIQFDSTGTPYSGKTSATRD
jgi:predicted ATP-grasp superfamily ATP-dependent carboligase